jgi:DeoR/GlpR family transcriptional regulator of sugar metabolism
MKLVQPGDKLILDAGSTTLQLARRLARSTFPLSVFTNSLPIANELGAVEGIDLLLSGGTLRKASQSLQGPQAEARLEGYVFDKLFLGRTAATRNSACPPMTKRKHASTPAWRRKPGKSSCWRTAPNSAASACTASAT